jgi:putative aminopeptidase FrvX
MELGSFIAAASNTVFIGGGEGGGEFFLGRIKKYSPEAHFDSLGNIIAPVFPRRPGGPLIMLEAHVDEVGFIVIHIDDGGFLRVSPVGGPDLRALPGRGATVFGREVLEGIFCCGKTGDRDELAIDIGYGRAQAEKLVRPGDTAALRVSASPLGEGLVTGKALDNRAGAAALLRALSLLGGECSGVGLTAVLSSGEELGEHGAKAAAFACAPTQAIVVDTSFAYTPDDDRGRCGELRKGPMIGVSPVLSQRVTGALENVARKAEIPYQKEIMGGKTGTDADNISESRCGVETGLLSVPLKYMHTACETAAVCDIENTARLIYEYIKSAGGHDIG